MTFSPLKERPGQTITLKYPFELDGVEYHSITFRRPKTTDLDPLAGLKGAAATKASREMLASLAELPPEVFVALDPEDMAQINDWLEPILDPKGAALRSAGS